MANSIVGSLPLNQTVDLNGSLSLDVPLQLPPARLSPKMSLGYHSAANTASALGRGWVMKGASLIERVPATVAQDGFRGVINYDKNDRFALDGQRLMHIGGEEYRFEVEQWSKILAKGSDPANPDYWIEHLPDGSIRKFGDTNDSNIKAKGGNATRIWAISDHTDGFSNYISYAYNNDTQQGSFYLTQISYGGNRTLSMAHQRRIVFEYATRPDKTVMYVGGYEVIADRLLASVSSYVQDELAHKHRLEYDEAPVTGISRLVSVDLVDPSGASVRPHKFEWVNENRGVFDGPDPTQAVTIETGDSGTQVIPMDVNASGRSSIVTASKRLESGVQKLYLAVYLADDEGRISSTPASVLTGLSYPTQLIPLDIDGDGRTDLLHIVSSMSSHTLTVLLSTTNGYEAQTPLTFTPEALGGQFYSGDFEGNGYVGLVYIYNTMRSGTQQLRFVQFTSDGKQFTALPASDGPVGASLDRINVVIGDLNGDGAEDVFIIYPRLKNSTTVCQIDLLESQDGNLRYRQDDGLTTAGEGIWWKSTTTFLPYSADEDGKTSLLAVSDNNGYLTLQLLRSSGPSLLPPPSPIATDIAYNGNVTLARTTSTTTVDLVNTFTKSFGDMQTQVTILRFYNDTFVSTEGVTQPGMSSNSVSWADVRGIGRADCLLNTLDMKGNLTISPMMCSSPLPIDFLSAYENGLGARTLVSYAPLSDRSMYSTDSTPNSPLPALNAMARNVSLTATLSSSPILQQSAHSRSQIVYFPSWVVKQTRGSPCAAKPTVVDQTDYTYANARLSFDGRGWLGFERITKSSQVLGTSETSHYRQSFPFLGQVSLIETTDRTSGSQLQEDTYSWESVQLNAGKNCSVRLLSLGENYYEAGARAYYADVSYKYDAFNNIAEQTIMSLPNTPSLTIQATYVNDEESWVIGNKTLEVIKDSDVLKQKKFAFVERTQTIKEVSTWVGGDIWSTQIFEFDGVGNETVVKGPGPALSTLTYDATNSFVIGTSTSTGLNDDPLTETAVFDLTLGKPLSVSDANGSIITMTYDVLGRMQQISQGDVQSGMTVVENRSYDVDGVDFYQVSQVRTESQPGQENWSETVDHVDGLDRKWRSERPSPDDPATVIYGDIEYDGAGRIVARSRDYFAGSTPGFTRYTYDAHSRVIKQTLPPAASGVSAITITSEYAFQSGVSRVTETRSEGNPSTDQVSTREIQFLPNPEPSAGKFLKPYVVGSTNELQQSIKTVFDGLGRPICVKDPSDVQLLLSWDGLSRLTERRLSNSGTKDISHSVVEYDDNQCLATVRNKLTGTSTVTKSDFVQRPISKTTADETLTYTYDKGVAFAKQRLVAVSSSKGIESKFDYNIRGNLIMSQLSLDGHDFVTTYDWTPFGQLLRTTNPDGTTIVRSFYEDGESVNKAVLADSDNTTRAWITLNEFKDVFSRPLVCEFGNGITSRSSIVDSGMLASNVLTKGGNVLHRQDWKIDAFRRIGKHDISSDNAGRVTVASSNAFSYNTAGQLVKFLPNSSSSNLMPEDFSYDLCGNLSTKGGRTFVNDGWQLSKIIGSDGSTECSFKYSADGNLISKLDDTGAETNMKYDANGRLVQLDETSFVYDFSGRLIKSVLPNGDVTMYPTQFYELTVSASGNTTHTSYLVHGYRRASMSKTMAPNKEDITASVVHYFHTDHLGSTIAASDENGEIVTLYQYDGFGKVSVDGPDVSRYKYSGKEQFGGLYYFGARFYDPDIGRFLTLDDYPLSLKNITPATFNMYSFSRNDPINFVDLNGNVPWWHWLVDAIAIVVGVALMFVPGLNVVAAIAVGALSGALLGGGLSGLSYDMSHSSGDYSDQDWGIAFGIGAGIGAVSGALGAGVDAMIPGVTVAEVAASRGAMTLRVIGGFAARTTARLVANTVIGSSLSVLQQLATNAATGRPLDEGLGDAAALGAIQALGTAAAADGLNFVKPLIGSKLQLKFWKDRTWGVYRLAHAEKVSGIGGLNTNVDYPLRQTAMDVGHFLTQLSDIPQPRLRYVHVEEMTSL